jgi:hypothetical protein
MNSNEAPNPDETPVQPSPPWHETFPQEFLSRILPNAKLAHAKPRKEPRLTAMGFPCARSWDDNWIARVEAAEQRLQHRICGARTMSGEPCELAPNHENGRCRFHGGFALTGAAPGNRNAVIHALYSRRLRVCDSQCPLWEQCPCAGSDVEAISAANRPTCPYEQTEYNTALTDALGRAATNPTIDPMTLHIAHNTALLQVMLTRASLALRNVPLIDTIKATRDATNNSGAYEMQSQKPSAHLQAFTRIASEYRHFAAMLKPGKSGHVSVAEHLNYMSRAMADTDLDPDRQELMHPDAFGTLNKTQEYVRDAIEQALDGDGAAAAESFRQACYLSPPSRHLCDRPVNGERYPDHGALSEMTVSTLLQHMQDENPPKRAKDPLLVLRRE